MPIEDKEWFDDIIRDEHTTPEMLRGDPPKGTYSTSLMTFCSRCLNYAPIDIGGNFKFHLTKSMFKCENSGKSSEILSS